MKKRMNSKHELEYKNGEIIVLLCRYIVRLLITKIPSIRLLFVRTPTTGEWMDTMTWTDKRVICDRYLYATRQQVISDVKKHEDIRIFETHQAALEYWKQQKDMERRYDVICLDGSHTYEESLADFLSLSSLLQQTHGIFLSHDCAPMYPWMCSPTFTEGPWCGCTFAAFIEFIRLSMLSSNLIYTILDIDTGIGIFTPSTTIFQDTLLSELMKPVESKELVLNIQKAFSNLFFSSHDIPRTLHYFRKYGYWLIHLVECPPSLLTFFGRP